MQRQIAITIEELFNEIREHIQEKNVDELDFYVYVDSDTCEISKIKLTNICYVDDRPYVSDTEDIEHFTDFVIQNDLKVFSSDENLISVISNALVQKKNVSNKDLLIALEYFFANDSFIDFSRPKSKTEWYGAILLDVFEENIAERLERFGESRLSGHREIFSDIGTLVYSNNKRCDVYTLANSTSILYTYGLAICINDVNWSHILYGNRQILSPSKYIPKDQAKKKKPKMQSGVIPEAFVTAFPHTDVNIIKNYISDEKDKTILIEKNGKFYVRENDRYDINNPLQGFDFIRYLGFDVEF